MRRTDLKGDGWGHRARNIQKTKETDRHMKTQCGNNIIGLEGERKEGEVGVGRK